jgi:Tol biopolymer transport system component
LSDTCDAATGGTAVAFGSYATNLVPGDTNGQPDVFAWDQSGAVERVSVTTSGEQSRTFTEWPTISDDGRFVAFSASGRRLLTERRDHRWMSVFVHDRVAGSTTRVSGPTDGGRVRGNASEASISGSGRYVAFVSSAPNLTVKRDRNDASDVFVHDRETGKTNRVSLTARGTETNSDSSGIDISADGRYVTYGSYANNIVGDDDNGAPDIFVYDRVERTTERVSLKASGKPSGSYSFNPTISADGRHVAFASWARLAPSDAAGTDVYVHDRAAGTTELVSVGTRGAGNGDSNYPSISDDGRYVAFTSFADTLVDGDTNEAPDAFVRDLDAAATARVSVGDEGQEANAGSVSAPAISPDGRYVCFSTAATNLGGAADDYPEDGDVYLRGPLF